MSHRMTCLSDLSSRLVRGLGMALLVMAVGGGAGLAMAQKPEAVLPGVAAPVLTPYSGPVEPQGQWLQSRDVRARELRSAFKTPVPLAPEAASADRKLSAAEREALRAQLKGQAHQAMTLRP
jgi:hypothetical protein